MKDEYKDQNQKVKIENERGDYSIYGTITMTFQFRYDYQIKYKFEDCSIENHKFKVDDQEEFILPIDLTINYCFPNKQGQEISLDISDYEIDDISDFNCSVDYEQYGTSSFFVYYIVISPNHQFIFICVDVQILGKRESYRMIVIDIKNQKMKKFFYRNHFIGKKMPQFSKDGNVAILDITKNQGGSRYLFFDLKNGIENAKIITFDDSFWRIEYDEKSACFYYITANGKIIQQPINLQDYSIDKSKRQKFQICPILNEYLDYNIRFYLLYDSIGLLLDDYGQFIVIRIAKNCKVIRNHFYEDHQPVFIFNKAFIVTSNYDQNQLLFINAIKGKLLRKREFTQARNYYQYYYPQKRSYYISYIFYQPQEDNCEDEDFQLMNLSQKNRTKWMIFDIIRGIEKEVNKIKLSQERIQRQIFTHQFVAQSYQNKIDFQLKL